MKRLLTVLTAIVCISLVSTAVPITAQAQSNNPSEPYAGLPLCYPDAYLATPVDCIPLGPSKILTDLAKLGLSIPPRPLPAYSPDPSLVNLGIKYAQVNGLSTGEQAPLYPSLEDAVAGQNSTSGLGPGEEFYVSYNQGADVNGNHYLLTSLGWIRASPAQYSTYQGLLFQQTPTNSFGWIVGDAVPHVAPAMGAAENGTQLPLYKVVQIYDVQQAEGTTWYMIGLNQWVNQLDIRQVKVESKPPAGVDNNRWIEVDVDPFGQTMSVYDKGQLVFATLIGSGIHSFYTRPGLFKIYEKKTTDTMTGSFQKDKLDFYSLADVPWTMYYDENRALHGAYWHARWGYVISHGCVNMSVGDAHWLFNWAHVGDWVYVYDPSGTTPTDPSLYGPGAP